MGPSRFSARMGVWSALFAGCLLSACVGSRTLPSNSAPLQTQSFSQSVNLPDREPVDMAATPPSAVSCTGPDPNIRVPNAPHGMYVWNPNHFGPFIETSLLKVIGTDPTLCGVSFVINWRDVNPARGSTTGRTSTAPRRRRTCRRPRPAHRPCLPILRIHIFTPDCESICCSPMVPRSEASTT